MKKNYKDVVNSRIDEIAVNNVEVKEENKPVKKPFPLWAKIVIPVASFSLVLTTVSVFTVPFIINSLANSPFFDENITLQVSNKNLFNIDTKVAKMNSLNNIVYPTSRGNYSYSDSELNSYLDFSYDIFKNVDYKSFSPANLYSILNALKGGVSDEDTLNLLNDLLGEEIDTSSFANKMFKNNYFVTDDGTTQIHNGAFFNSAHKNDFYPYSYNVDYVNFLTDSYYETYELNFSEDVSGILEWVNKALNSNNFIDESFLDLNDDTALYLFSTLYFDHYWSNKYVSDNNVIKEFKLKNGEEVKTTFMNHSYVVNSYYDYDEYISFDDYYATGNKITYLVVKDGVNKDILDVIKNHNFLFENEENKIKTKLVDEQYDIYNNIYVNLTTPKFDQEMDLKFDDALKQLGFDKLYTAYYDTLANCFDDPYNYYYSYLQTIKQRTNIKFNEDGSLLKTLVMAEIGLPGAAAPINEDEFENIYLNVELNEPFVYIIKDHKDLPLFIGYMDDPR